MVSTVLRGNVALFVCVFLIAFAPATSVLAKELIRVEYSCTIAYLPSPDSVQDGWITGVDRNSLFILLSS